MCPPQRVNRRETPSRFRACATNRPPCGLSNLMSSSRAGFGLSTAALTTSDNPAAAAPVPTAEAARNALRETPSTSLLPTSSVLGLVLMRFPPVLRLLVDYRWSADPPPPLPFEIGRHQGFEGIKRLAHGPSHGPQ